MGNSNAIENKSCTYIILVYKTTLYQKWIPHTKMSWKSGITRYSGYVYDLPTAFCSTEVALLFAL